MIQEKVIHQKSVIHSGVLKDGEWLCDLPLDQLAQFAADPEARMWGDLENVDDPQVELFSRLGGRVYFFWYMLAFMGLVTGL